MAVVERTVLVSGMTCDGCERSVASAVGRLDGVEEARASHAAGTVVVRYEDDRVGMDEIGRAIEDAGYDLGDGVAHGGPAAEKRFIGEIPLRKPDHP
jgi:copper chaperone CopZ